MSFGKLDGGEMKKPFDDEVKGFSVFSVVGVKPVKIFEHSSGRITIGLKYY